MSISRLPLVVLGIVALHYAMVSLMVERDVLVSVRYLQKEVSDGRMRPLMNALLPFTAELHHGSWCVLPNAFAPQGQPNNAGTLVLRLSADYLEDSLIANGQLENCNGPVSLSVYAMNLEVEIPCAAEFIEGLTMDNLQLHFFYMSSSSGSCALRTTASENCSRRTKAEKTLEKLAAYLANVARNIAGKYASTKCIILGDFDHMFSEGFETRLSELAEREFSADPLAVLVYRIFEIDDAVKENPKADLVNFLNEDRSIIFHAKYYSAQAHSIPGLEERLYKESGTGDGIFARNLTLDKLLVQP